MRLSSRASARESHVWPDGDGAVGSAVRIEKNRERDAVCSGSVKAGTGMYERCGDVLISLETKEVKSRATHGSLARLANLEPAEDGEELEQARDELVVLGDVAGLDDVQELVERPETPRGDRLVVLDLLGRRGAVLDGELLAERELAEVLDPAAHALEVQLGHDALDGTVVERGRAVRGRDERLEEWKGDGRVRGQEDRQRGGLH